jgi:hypothetical protein
MARCMISISIFECSQAHARLELLKHRFQPRHPASQIGIGRVHPGRVEVLLGHTTHLRNGSIEVLGIEGPWRRLLGNCGRGRRLQPRLELLQARLHLALVCDDAVEVGHLCVVLVGVHQRCFPYPRKMG